MQKTVEQRNSAQLAHEVEVIVLTARRAAPADAKTVEELWPFVVTVMRDMGVDDTMARHVRRQLDAKGIRLDR